MSRTSPLAAGRKRRSDERRRQEGQGQEEGFEQRSFEAIDRQQKACVGSERPIDEVAAFDRFR
jgi:hypothetical protein